MLATQRRWSRWRPEPPIELIQPAESKDSVADQEVPGVEVLVAEEDHAEEDLVAGSNNDSCRSPIASCCLSLVKNAHDGSAIG